MVRAVQTLAVVVAVCVLAWGAWRLTRTEASATRPERPPTTPGAAESAIADPPAGARSASRPASPRARTEIITPVTASGSAAPGLAAAPKPARLRVRINGPDGKPHLGNTRIHIDLAGEVPAPDGGVRLPWDPARTQRTDDGWVVFTSVPLARSFVVVATPQDPFWLPVRQSVVGPAEPGAEVVTNVSLGAHNIVVAGFLSDAFGSGPPSGDRTKRRSIHAVCRNLDELPVGDIPSAKGAVHVTPGYGLFQLVFAVDVATMRSPAIRIDASALFTDAVVAEADPSQLVTVTLTEACRAGPVDVGKIVVPEGAVAVSGIVVDELGARVVDADVSVESYSGTGWRAAPELAARANRTGKSGRFAIHGKPEATRVRVIASKRGLVCMAPVEFMPGAQDVVLKLSTPGVVAGSFRAPPVGRTRAPLRITFTADATADGREPIDMPVAADGSWSRELMAGTYRVDVFSPPGMKPVRVVENVAITAGRVTRDPRLQDVDL